MNKSRALRTGYYNALSGSISYNGNTVKVYDSYVKIEDSESFYVILSTQTSSQRGAKTNSKFYDDTILIDIVTKFSKPAGKSASEDIAEQIETAIDAGIDITPNGYKIGNTNLESDTDLETVDNQIYIFRKLMRYKHLIDKL